MPYTVRLRHDTFTETAKSAGFRSDYALAQAMQINRSTLARVLGEELQPGPAFIAGALTALASAKFADLFEIVHIDRKSPRT